MCYSDDLTVLTLRLKITEQTTASGLQKKMLVSLGAAAARELVQYKYYEDGEVIGRTHVFSNLYYLIFGIFCDLRFILEDMT